MIKYKNENLNLIILLIFSQIILNSSNIIQNSNGTIIFPLKTMSIPFSNEDLEKSNDPLGLIINKIIPNNLYLQIKINNNKIEFPGYLTFNSQFNYFGIKSCIELNNNNIYYVSSPVEKLLGLKIFNNQYQDYFHTKETIRMSIVNNKKDELIIEGMDFIIPEDNERKAKCLILGLNPAINNKTNIKIQNLPLTLKANNKNNIFKAYLTILYNNSLKQYNKLLNINNINNNYDGLLIIGEYPHILYPNLFNIKQYKEIDNYEFKNEQKDFYYKGSEQNSWSIEINGIYCKDIKINQKKYIGEFSIDLFPFILPMELFSYFIDIYMNNYIKKDICFKKGRPLSRKFTHTLHNDKRQTFIFIHCEKNKIKNITEFYNSMPDIQFRSESLNKTFEFSKKELFVEKEGYIYLMLIPDLFNNMKITLGKIFMEKYIFTFNYDTNKIGFYDFEINKKEINKFFENNFLLIVYQIILFIIVFFTIILYVNYITNKKKKKKLKKNNKEKVNEEELIDVNLNEKLI